MKNNQINIGALIASLLYFSVALCTIVGMPIYYVIGLFNSTLLTSNTLIIIGILSMITSILIITLSFIKPRFTKCPHGVRGATVRQKCQLCIIEEEKEKSIDALNSNIEEVQKNIKQLNIEKNRIQEKLKLNKLSSLQELNPYIFESEVIMLFKNLGFSAQQTSKSNDGGLDGVARYKGLKYGIECKRYKSSNKISRPVLQRFFAALHDHDATEGYFVTTSDFSAPAIEYSRRKGNIRLINGSKLVELMTKYNISDSLEPELLRIERVIVEQTTKVKSLVKQIETVKSCTYTEFQVSSITNVQKKENTFNDDNKSSIGRSTSKTGKVLKIETESNHSNTAFNCKIKLDNGYYYSVWTNEKDVIVNLNDSTSSSIEHIIDSFSDMPDEYVSLLDYILLDIQNRNFGKYVYLNPPAYLLNNIKL